MPRLENDSAQPANPGPDSVATPAATAQADAPLQSTPHTLHPFQPRRPGAEWPHVVAPLVILPARHHCFGVRGRGMRGWPARICMWAPTALRSAPPAPCLIPCAPSLSPPPDFVLIPTVPKSVVRSFPAAASALPCAPNPRGEGRLRGIYHHRCDIPLNASQQHAPKPSTLPPWATRPKPTPVAPHVILPARHHCWGFRGRGTRGWLARTRTWAPTALRSGPPAPIVIVCAYVPQFYF